VVQRMRRGMDTMTSLVGVAAAWLRAAEVACPLSSVRGSCL
jgi:hypothetical protein